MKSSIFLLSGYFPENKIQNNVHKHRNDIKMSSRTTFVQFFSSFQVVMLKNKTT